MLPSRFEIQVSLWNGYKWNGRSTILNDPEIDKVLTGQFPLNKLPLRNIESMAFIKTHLAEFNKLTDDQKEMSPSDKHFITSVIGHSILTDVYVSAKELEDHFRNSKQPVYTMTTWGQSPIEVGYHLHALLIFGVDTRDNIHFWDVSDKLAPNTPRVRTMHIEEFNDRRNLPPQYAGIVRGGMTRSQIYYFKEEK